MAAITTKNITDEQLARVIYYFHVYHEVLNKNPESMLAKLNIAKRTALRKHISGLNELYKELDRI